MVMLFYRLHEEIGEECDHQQSRHAIHGGVVEARRGVDGPCRRNFHQLANRHGLGLDECVELIDRCTEFLSKRGWIDLRRQDFLGAAKRHFQQRCDGKRTKETRRGPGRQQAPMDAANMHCSEQERMIQSCQNCGVLSA